MNLQSGLPYHKFEVFKRIIPMTKASRTPKTDVVLMGAGIMSATLGMLLKELDPNLSIHIFERLDKAGSSKRLVVFARRGLAGVFW